MPMAPVQARLVARHRMLADCPCTEQLPSGERCLCPLSVAGTGGHATPSRSSVLAPASAALLRQASHASSAGAAAALLRHVSCSLDPLGLESGEVPWTPHTLGDISGFEDLLEDDHRSSLERRRGGQPGAARAACCSLLLLPGRWRHRDAYLRTPAAQCTQARPSLLPAHAVKPPARGLDGTTRCCCGPVPAGG